MRPHINVNYPQHFLKKIENFIRNRIGNHRGDSTLAEFFKEVEEYRAALDQAYTNILGKKKAAKVLELDGYLLSPDLYFFKSSSLKNYTAYGFAAKENLLFYVVISLEEEDKFKISSIGKIEGDLGILKTSPCFFFSRGIIKKHAGELKKTSLPPYLTLWIHEYSHFIGYCLQKRPVAVAISILYDHLAKERDKGKGLTVRDLTNLIGNKRDEKAGEVARTIIYLHSLDEDMANFLEEIILEEMGFNAGEYFSEKMKNSSFYPYFKKWGKQRFVEYIEDWNNAEFQAPQFMKNFLKSLNRIEIERHPRGML